MIGTPVYYIPNNYVKKKNSTFSEIPFLSISSYVTFNRTECNFSLAPFSNFKIWDRIINDTKSK